MNINYDKKYSGFISFIDLAFLLLLAHIAFNETFNNNHNLVRNINLNINSNEIILNGEHIYIIPDTTKMDFNISIKNYIIEKIKLNLNDSLYFEITVNENVDYWIPYQILSLITKDNNICKLIVNPINIKILSNN